MFSSSYYDYLFGDGQKYVPTVTDRHWREGDTLLIEVQVPGYDLADLNLKIAGQVLTLIGTRESGQKKQTVYRQWVLTDVDPYQATCTLDKGLLLIKLPLKAEEVSREITINAESEHKNG